ncbi:MAG TPA: tetratricopeptide repeat protein [Ignavibacteria bacterium]|nr:tetratricopeptide repeat protein [Ignavibacteria bacterium]
MNKYSIAAALLLLISFSLFSQDQMSPVTGSHDLEKVTIDKYVFETALNSADRTITFLQWVIGVFSGVITILFVIFKYRDEKSLQKNRDELKESQDKIERIRLELIEEEHKMKLLVERLQSVTGDYESKISAIEDKILTLENKSDELDRKTDNMNEINRYFSIAYNSVESGNYSEAVKYYTKIIESNPDELTLKVVLNNRGIALQNLGKNDLALKDYQQVIDIDPLHPQSYGNRGNVYDSTGNYEKAIADYSKGIELKSDYTDAFYNRGWVYLKTGEYNKAIADFKRLIQISPADIDAMFSLGESYLLDGSLPAYENILADIKSKQLNENYRTVLHFFELLGKIAGGENVDRPAEALGESIKMNGKLKWNTGELNGWAKNSPVLSDKQKARVIELLSAAG